MDKEITGKELITFLEKRIEADDRYRRITGMGLDSQWTIAAFKIALESLTSKIDKEE